MITSFVANTKKGRPEEGHKISEKLKDTIISKLRGKVVGLQEIKELARNDPIFSEALEAAMDNHNSEQNAA